MHLKTDEKGNLPFKFCGIHFVFLGTFLKNLILNNVYKAYYSFSIFYLMKFNKPIYAFLNKIEHCFPKFPQLNLFIYKNRNTFI